MCVSVRTFCRYDIYKKITKFAAIQHPIFNFAFNTVFYMGSGRRFSFYYHAARSEEPLTEMDPFVVSQLLPGAEQKEIFRSNSNRTLSCQLFSKQVVECSLHKVTMIYSYHLLQPSSYLNCLWQLPQGYLRKGSSSPCCLARWSRNKHFHCNAIFKNETLMPIKSL